MDAKTLKARRNSLLGLLVILFFSAGWLDVYASSPVVLISTTFGISTAVALLIITLSQIQNRPIVRSLHWIIYFFWPVVAPVYIIQFYRWKGVGFLALAILAYLICLNAGYYSALFING